MPFFRQRLRAAAVDTRRIARLIADLGSDEFTKEGQDMLRGWDYSNPIGRSDSSASAAYFNAVWANLVELTFNDELPDDLRADGGDQWMQTVTELLDKPRSPWWDNKLTPGVTEGEAEILRQALVEARLDLTKELGKDPAETIAIFRIPGAWEEEGYKILDRYGVEYADRTTSMWDAAGIAVQKIQGGATA